MSLPLPLTRRWGSYQQRSLKLCYCTVNDSVAYRICDLSALLLFIDGSNAGSILIGFPGGCCGAQCRLIDMVIYSHCNVKMQTHVWEEA